MPNPRTSFHHPASSPRGVRAGAMAAALGSMLTGLLMPAASAAALDCAASLDTVVLPANATEVLRDETLRVNNRPICYVGFETDDTPTDIIDRQTAAWSKGPGEFYDPPLESTSRPHTLFYAEKTETRHLVAIPDGDKTAVTVSVMPVQPVEPATTPSTLSLPPALEPMLEQRNRHGSTTVIDTAIPPTQARQRLTDHLRDRGWTLESHTEGAHGLETVSMRRDGQLLEIGVMGDGDRTALIANLIRSGAVDEQR